MITVGILVSYPVAVLILLAQPHNSGNLDWRLILGIGAIPAIVAVAMPSKMPEPPGGMLHERHSDAGRHSAGSAPRPATRRSARSPSNCGDRRIQRQRTTQWTKGVIRALIVACVFFIFQQIPPLMGCTGPCPTMAETDCHPHTCL
jgi:MFS transporter, SP family, arabinose:H+ symporter